MVRFAVAVLLVILLPSAVQAQGRFALLIGNQAYNAKVGPLRNPHNDIAAVSRALEAIEFKTTTLRDADRREVLSAVTAFAEQLAREGPNAVGFFYYSGHGISRPDNRGNYLIPVDLRDTESSDFWFDAVKLDDILTELERAAPFAAHFVVFDACRNELKLPVKSAARLGFQPVTERSGMYIAFATSPGAVASDQGTGSGPYARVLSTELLKHGQDHLQLFQNVKEGVYSSTGNRQVPWESNGLLKRIYLSGVSTPSKPAPLAPPPQASEASLEWARVDKTSIVELETFHRRHASSPEAEYARARLEELKKRSAVARADAEAETKRRRDESLAAEKKTAEEKKRLAMVTPSAPPVAADLAVRFMAQAGPELLAAARSAPTAMANWLQRYSDVSYIALYALGSYRNKLPDAQRSSYYDGAMRFIARYASKEMPNYPVATMAWSNQSARRADGVMVDSTIIMADGSTRDVRYRLWQYGDTFKVRDVMIDGLWMTQSLKMLFEDYITKNGGDPSALITRLNH